MKTKQKHASFDVTKQERGIIATIAVRAFKMAAGSNFKYPVVDAYMDVTACHANGMPLKLEALLAADDFNFAHDVFGIRQHINRDTGEIQDCFVPRYADL